MPLPWSSHGICLDLPCVMRIAVFSASCHAVSRAYPQGRPRLPLCWNGTLIAWLLLTSISILRADAETPFHRHSRTNRTNSAKLDGSDGQKPIPGPPYQLNVKSIAQMAFRINPSVRASREEMKAAKHGLDEFRANLNRLEPYVEMRNNLTRFPFQRSGIGHELTSVVGVQKESFEGSVMKLEVGPSFFARYAEHDDGLGRDPRDGEAGAFIGSRVEFPFLGSRRRQDRIISQAFQESTARKAQLDYLKSYRALVENALSYFNLVIYYRQLAQAYEHWGKDLDALLADKRLRPLDRSRVESVKGSAESYRGQYVSRETEYLSILMGYLGLDSTNAVEIEIADYQMSAFAVSAQSTKGLESLVEKARQNNPTFEVLNNAIRNTQLQHEQAVRGKFDVTTFLEGSLYPFGSKDLDSRSTGWAMGGGVNVRLNDQRARTATRLKTEALVRQFEAEIEAEEINIRRKIHSTTKAIWDNDANRTQMLEVGRRKSTEFKERLEEYYANSINIDQLMSTRSDIASNAASLANVVYNSADREATLLLAVGQIYEMVGLKIGSNLDEP